MPENGVLSRLTAECRKTLKNSQELLTEVNKEMERMGAKVVKQYALLGRYDFLTILEAADNETVAKVTVELGSRGSLETTTLAAMNINDFLRSMRYRAQSESKDAVRDNHGGNL